MEAFYRSSSSAIFVDDAVPQSLLYCVCGHKKRFDQLFGFCGQKGQLQLKFVKFKQFMALMGWPCNMRENGVGNLLMVTWVWQMNKGAGVLPHQQILFLQLRRLCVLIAECCLRVGRTVWSFTWHNLGHCSRTFRVQKSVKQVGPSTTDRGQQEKPYGCIPHSSPSL